MTATWWQRKHLVLTGFSLPKATLASDGLLAAMARDRDLRQLLAIGRRGLGWATALALAALAAALATLLGWGTQLLAGSVPWFVLVGIMVLSLPSFASIVREGGNLTRYLRSLIDSRSPRVPLDIWTPFPAALSDMSVAPCLAQAKHTSCKPGRKPGPTFVAFANEPYYHTQYNDSIVLDFANLPFDPRPVFAASLRDYAVELVRRQGQGQYQDPVTRDVLSRYGFGIKFASFYLKRILDRLRHACPGAYFGLRTDLPGVQGRLALEFLMLVTGPQDACLCSEPGPTCAGGTRFEVTAKDVRSLRSTNWWPRSPGSATSMPWQQDGTWLPEEQVRLPVKRWISVPKAKSETAVDALLPDIPGLGKESDVWAVGGPEVNLGLLHLINQHRWFAGDARVFGIAENAFDADPTRNRGFCLVGTENRVYTSAARTVNAADQNIAFLLHFPVRGFNVLGFCGMSALMTQAATAAYIHALSRSEESDLRGDGPPQSYVIDATRIPDFRAKWDKHDPMNRPLSKWGPMRPSLSTMLPPGIRPRQDAEQSWTSYAEVAAASDTPKRRQP
jgi:hypothetical protein